MYLSTVERSLIIKLWGKGTEHLIYFIEGYLGAPAGRFCVQQRMSHGDLMGYIRHHIHLLTESDLEKALDEAREDDLGFYGGTHEDHS